jgi:hypothetical protein
MTTVKRTRMNAIPIASRNTRLMPNTVSTVAGG